MKKYQNGFGAVEGLLLSVVVVIIAVAGWYVWYSNGRANKSYSQASKDTASKVTAKYLEIPEYKIKIPLSPAISDAYYLDVKGNAEVDVGAIVFGLHSFDSGKTIPDNCKPSQSKVSYASDGAPDADGIAGLYYDSVDNPVGLSQKKRAAANETKIGNKYFIISGIYACRSDNSAAKEKIKSVQQAFENAGAHIVKM